MNLPVVIEFPATKVVRRFAGQDGVTALRHGDKLGALYESARHGTLIRQYTVGTVFGYAIQNFEDPEAERARNHKNGGADHWINASGSSITAHTRPQEVVTFIEVGMLVRIEGTIYTVTKEPNNNLGLRLA